MLLTLVVSCGPEARPPNVLLIVADDLGYNDLAINNSNSARHTPTLDQLAREGVRFTRHYADSTCSPARAALLTGMSAARLGFTPNARGLSPQLITLAEALGQNGYQTAHIGKWHLGETLRDAWPDRQGFAHWFGFLSQWLLQGVHRDGVLAPAAPRYTDPWLMRDGDSGARYPGYLDDILSSEAIRQIRELGAGGKPWFINLWYYSPHAPLTPEARFAALEADTPEGHYRAMVRQLDANVERVLEALEETGQKDSTLIVFLSDNGAPTNVAHDANFPFYGGKTNFYEGGLRTPLVIRWPGAESGGTVRDDVVAIQDIYPTILARVGIKAPSGLDGYDIGQRPAPARDLFWELGAAQHFPYSLLHEGRLRLYKLWPFDSWEKPAILFDVDRNPSAPRDIAGSMSEMLYQLEQRRVQIQRSLHRPDFNFTRNADGSGQLEGLDFLRTPGYGAFTFAIGIGPDYIGRVAGQSGIWSLDLAEDGTLTADFQGHGLRAQLPSGGCRAVILSGFFARETTNWRGDTDRMRLSMQVNGENVATLEVPGAVDASGFAQPTLIGTAGATGINALLSNPVILTEHVGTSSSIGPEELGRELCPAVLNEALNRP